MQKVLVAGSTGYLGKYVVREFKRRGYWVRALARVPATLEEMKGAIDEIVVGDVTKPETLSGVCDGVEIVFSSVGAPVTIAGPRDLLSYRDVDYPGNKNLLEVAIKAAIRKFIYVSVFNGYFFKHLEYAKAHEDFVRELQGSGLDYAVVRPTMYFSAAGEILEMARSGRAYVIGGGESKENPIHGADLAQVCVDAVSSQQREIPVGGPVAYTRREMAELAFLALGKKPAITSLPPWLVHVVLAAIRPFNPRLYALAAFAADVMQVDLIAPPTGTHTLEQFYQETASRWGKRVRGRLRMAALLRLAGIGVLSGLVAGFLVGGIGSRIAMRMVALAAGTSPVFTGSTLSILLMGTLFGIPLGLLFVAVKRWLPGPGLRKGLTFGVLLLLFPGVPFFVDPASALNEGPLLLGISLFGVLFMGYAVAVAATAEWVERVLPEVTQSRVATVGYVFLALLGLFGLTVLIISIFGG